MKRGPLILLSTDPGAANELAAIGRFVRRHYSEVLVREVPIKELTPDLMGSAIVCGTSATAKAQVGVYAQAAKAGIPVFAVVDHWTNMKSRFDAEDEPSFPDEVWVNDSEARDLAFEAGLPAKRVRIFGNPYLYEAARYMPSARLKKSDFWAALKLDGLNPYARTFLFLSDNLIESEGSEAAAIRKYGFSQASILGEILKALPRAASTELNILVKLHPKEDRRSLVTVVPKGMRIQWIQGEAWTGPDLWPLIHHSDFQAGMFTGALLEAALLGKRPLRVELGAKDTSRLLPAPMSKKGAGVWDYVTDSKLLSAALAAYLGSRPERRGILGTVQTFDVARDFSFAAALDRVLR